jgi:hypothetical protein
MNARVEEKRNVNKTIKPSRQFILGTKRRINMGMVVTRLARIAATLFPTEMRVSEEL